MITINAKTDPRIAETFPEDPYSNLTIITAKKTVHLQLAFLAMDSDYFAGIDPDTTRVDLSELPEEPLMRILHSLYGAQLTAASLADLCELYPVIVHLGIQDYKYQIEQEIQGRPQLLESIQFLEVSFKYGLCWEAVLQKQMATKLRQLQDSKYYLQLSKISDGAFNSLILQFLERFGDEDSRVLNNAMENYFNRKNIKPLQYLKQLDCPRLAAVWLKHHHVPAQVHNPKSSQIFDEPDPQENRPRNRTEFMLPAQKEKESFVFGNQKQSLLQKKKRVHELQNEIEYKDNLIMQLTEKITELKRQLGINSPLRSIKQQMAKPATLQSLLFDADRKQPASKPMRLADLSPTAHSIINMKKTSQEEKPAAIAKEDRGLQKLTKLMKKL